MSSLSPEQIFNSDALRAIFPEERTERFFEALFGSASEGAYSISLHFRESRPDRLLFEFHLSRRPGKCLTCNLTSGLPQVFSRHPVIDVKGLVERIGSLGNGQYRCTGWQLGRTNEVSDSLHVIPLTVSLADPRGGAL